MVLIPLHVYTGCDTTCAFIGRGKKVLYDKGTSTEESRKFLANVGKDIPDDVINDLEMFAIRYIHNDKQS